MSEEELLPVGSEEKAVGTEMRMPFTPPRCENVPGH